MLKKLVTNDLIEIEIFNTNTYTFIKLLSKFKINYKSLNIKESSFTLLIDYKNYKRITKLLNKKDYKVISLYGIRKLKLLLKEHYLFLTSLLISVIMVYSLSNILFEININTNDEHAKKVVLDSLSESGIEIYKFMPKFEKLEEIRKKILKENKDLIDWMSIERNGTTYNINLNLRIKESDKKKGIISDIVAKKDGLIKHISASAGVIVKEENEYVKKGETIISGNIIKSDKYLKGQVESKGKVYAEVWYTVSASIPFKSTDFVKTDISYNEYYTYLFGKKLTFINQYKFKHTMKEESVYISKVFLPFKIYKSSVDVYEYKTTLLNEFVAYEKAIKDATSKISLILDKDEYIISKKVLKKSVQRSKIELIVFFKVYENITMKKEIDKIEIGTDLTKEG